MLKLPCSLYVAHGWIFVAFAACMSFFRVSYANDARAPSFEPLFSLPALDVRVPKTDLEDRGKDFLLKAEMLGFTKEEDINIEVTTDSVEIEGTVGWKYDNKTQNYICKERECSTFYRTESFPEEIDVDKVQAKLENGILELILPKKTPKKKKKIHIK